MLNIIKNYINYLVNKNKPACYDEYDKNMFGAEVVGGQVTREDLTDESFQTGHLMERIDQKHTDFCVGVGRSYGGQCTENKVMSWRGAFALGCKYLGYIPKWGISIRGVCLGSVKYGTPEKELCEYKWSKTREWNADWKNISDEAIKNAEKHKQKSVAIVNVPIGFDKFDAFRAFLNKYKDDNIVIQTGVDGHNVTLFGQCYKEGELKLFGIDSYGKRSINYRIGKSIEGIRYFSRQEANQLFNGYIVFDLERELVEILNMYNGKVVKTDKNIDCYLIDKGKKHLIPDEKIAWSHGFLLAPNDENKLVEVIEEKDLDKIPLGEDLKFEGGDNEWIIRRIYEKNKLSL